MKPLASGVFFAALTVWTVAWVWVVRGSGWLSVMPLWAWLLVLAVTAASLELLYRRTRPDTGGDLR